MKRRKSERMLSCKKKIKTLQLDSIVKPQKSKEINLESNLKLNLNERKQTEMKYNEIRNNLFVKICKNQNLKPLLNDLVAIFLDRIWITSLLQDL